MLAEDPRKPPSATEKTTTGSQAAAQAARELLEPAPSCPACRIALPPPDGDLFCSSCVKAGWDIAYRRGMEDAKP